ncbi:hypothetical protein ONZ45_g8840 [Pleurotus djamor]|nr:hypothetical protein ONZ45_g8840 [Pleurotus djamor]
MDYTITPVVPPRKVHPVNDEWHIPPAWVPDCAYVSLIDGKWRAGDDKDAALANEEIGLPPPSKVPFDEGIPRTIDQVDLYIRKAHEPDNHHALAYVLSWIKATEKISPSQHLPWMTYLRSNWRRPDWIKDQHPNSQPRRSGSGHIARHKGESKLLPPLSRPRWDAPIEEWGHFFWTSPRALHITNGISKTKNNSHIKLRQVRGYIIVASRAPVGVSDEAATSRGTWYRACAELIAFPGLYGSLATRTNISDNPQTLPAVVPTDTSYTADDAAEELRKQGVTTNEIDDAQPYGFFWLLHNMSHPRIGGAMKTLIDEINRLPKVEIEQLFAFEPRFYPDPAKAVIDRPQEQDDPGTYVNPDPLSTIFEDDPDLYSED